MKKKKLIVLLACIIFIIILFITKIIIDENILKNEEKQIAFLEEEYYNFLKNTPYYIKFDTSALKNLVTDENFKEENIVRLKRINETRKDAKYEATLYRNYSKYYKRLYLELKIIKNGQQLKISDTNYKLQIKNFKIKGIGRNSYHINKWILLIYIKGQIQGNNILYFFLYFLFSFLKSLTCHFDII